MNRPPSNLSKPSEQEPTDDFTAHLVARYGVSREVAEAQLGELLMEYRLQRRRQRGATTEAERPHRDTSAARWTPVPVH